MLRSTILLICSLISFTTLAEQEAYNRVDFQIEVARDVSNNLLVATMSAQFQDKLPSRVALQLNSVLNDALKQAAAFSSVKSSSGNQFTAPVYGKNNQITAWRGHGEIRLESRDFKAAGELIMQLQATLQLGGLQFILAPDSRLQIENTLMSEAIKAFQSRAEAIRSDMGAKSYKTVHFSITAAPLNYPMQMMRSAAIADNAIPAPEFSAGESRMTLQINGTIELQ